MDINTEFAEWFRWSKQQLVDHKPDGFVHQTGCAYLASELALPNASHLAEGLCATGETLIETFMVSADADGSGSRAEPTGSDASLIEMWRPAVEEFLTRMDQACNDLGIERRGMSYLTASVTPASEVIGLPHFDDGQYIANDGVGLVGIVGDTAGSRVATEPVAHLPTRPGLPLDIDDQVIDDFFAGRVAQQHSDPNRIVVFPQFAQLHSGPQLSGGMLDHVRCMLVYRAATAVAAVPS